MSQILFNRTVKTNIIIYPTDGTGRDGYITFNNGGFWKQNIKRYSLKEKYKRSSFARFRSIRKTPPIWNYHADGTGRDSYILYDYGGLINNFYRTPNFNNFRSYDENNGSDSFRKTSNNLYMSADEKKYHERLTKIQKDVVNRLYYKPKNELKLNHLKRENSHGNVFSKLKLEPIISNHSNVDNQKNEINDTINGRYFNNNDGLRSPRYLDNIFNEEKNDINKRSRNKLSLFKNYKIKCLSNKFDEKNNCYPFNQFNNKINLSKKDYNNKKSNLFNY